MMFKYLLQIQAARRTLNSRVMCDDRKNSLLFVGKLCSQIAEMALFKLR